MNTSRFPHVAVKRSSAGLGLFAGEDIEAEAIIIEYIGEHIPTADADSRGGKYLFTLDDDWVIDGKGRHNTARYINHACTPNAEAEIDEEENRIFIRSCRAVKKGEEITYDYGPEYFNDHIKPVGCKCQSCVKRKK